MISQIASHSSRKMTSTKGFIENVLFYGGLLLQRFSLSFSSQSYSYNVGTFARSHKSIRQLRVINCRYGSGGMRHSGCHFTGFLYLATGNLSFRMIKTNTLCVLTISQSEAHVLGHWQPVIGISRIMMRSFK